MKKTSIAPPICFAVFLFLYGITSRADLQFSDEVAVFASGISLATRGKLDIDSLRWLQTRENLGKEYIDGHLYTKYFPGNVLGTALLYRIAEKRGDSPFISSGYGLTPEPHQYAPSNTGARAALRLNSLLGALGVTALYAALLRRFDWKTATATALLFGCCTDWWYQARGLFSETGAGALLMIGVYFADRGLPSLCGASLGLSLLFRPTNLLGLPIWLFTVWKRGLKSAWTVFFLIAAGCLLLAYNWLRFRSLLDFGYGDEQFNGWIVEGLVGVLLSPGRSLFFYSPVLILCISGARMFYKRDPVLTATLLTITLGYILVTASWHSWDGGTSWGSRLITPVLPLMGFLLAPMVEKAFSKRRDKTRFYLILLATLGFGIQMLTMAISPLYVLVYYILTKQIPYSDAINSFHNSWLSLQIRYLEHWNTCNIDCYSIRNLFAECR